MFKSNIISVNDTVSWCHLCKYFQRRLELPQDSAIILFFCMCFACTFACLICTANDCTETSKNKPQSAISSHMVKSNKGKQSENSHKRTMKLIVLILATFQAANSKYPFGDKTTSTYDYSGTCCDKFIRQV